MQYFFFFKLKCSCALNSGYGVVCEKGGQPIYTSLNEQYEDLCKQLFKIVAVFHGKSLFLLHVPGYNSAKLFH